MGRFILIVLWIVYFLSPLDVIPDFIPGVGRLDDLILLLILVYSIMKRRPDLSGESSDSADYRQQSHGTGSRRERDTQRVHTEARKDPYQILGIQHSASVEEIRRAYRTQASRYHPDKVTHLGEEFQTLAKEKFQEIQWAYETILAERKVS